MFGSGWETIPAVQEWWEALPNVRELSRVSPGRSRSARRSGNGRDTLSDVPDRWKANSDGRQLSGVPPEYPGVVGSSSRKYESGQDAFLDTRELSGGPHRCLE